MTAYRSSHDFFNLLQRNKHQRHLRQDPPYEQMDVDDDEIIVHSPSTSPSSPSSPSITLPLQSNPILVCDIKQNTNDTLVAKRPLTTTTTNFFAQMIEWFHKNPIMFIIVVVSVNEIVDQYVLIETMQISNPVARLIFKIIVVHILIRCLMTCHV
jgi:hypothetical protein